MGYILLQIGLTYTVFLIKTTYISRWSDLSTSSDWSNQQSLIALHTDIIKDLL